MIRYLILFSGVLLSACGLSPERIDEVDAAAREHRGSISVRPAESPPPVRSPLDHIEADGGRHHLVQIDHGSDALAMRIHLIRAARERIELMNYIFHGDTSGKLLIGELVGAARRGVKVRVLLDGLFSLNDHGLLAALELVHDNFEVRLYNTLFDRAKLNKAAIFGATFCCFRSLNHRMHNKSLSVDGRHALIGGRNSGDRYFDLDTDMNFLDLEVLVTGPAVVDIGVDFDRFWESALAHPARHTHEVADILLARPPDELDLERDSRAAFGARLAADPEWMDQLLDKASFEVDELTYFSDPPGKTWRLEDEVSTRTLHDLIGQARHRVVVQTPYFVLSRAFERVLADLGSDVEIVISTNSLAASDAYPVHAISRRQRYRLLAKFGAELYEARPYPANPERFIRRYPMLVAEKSAGVESPLADQLPSPTRPMPGPRFSVHAKLLVIDDEIAVVTSHNFDPRSEIFNTENGIYVRDAAFARSLTDYIEAIAAPGNSWVVAPRPRGVPVIGSVNRFMAQLSRRLPMLDLWPWYLTENYQLDRDAVPVAPRDAAFHNRHQPVGMTPEVARLRLRLMTSLISRMFGFMRPLM